MAPGERERLARPEPGVGEERDEGGVAEQGPFEQGQRGGFATRSEALEALDDALKTARNPDRARRDWTVSELVTRYTGSGISSSGASSPPGSDRWSSRWFGQFVAEAGQPKCVIALGINAPTEYRLQRGRIGGWRPLVLVPSGLTLRTKRRTMRKFSLAILAIAGVFAAIVAGVFAAMSPAAYAQTDVCPTLDGKYEIPQGWQGTPAPGITVIASSEESFTFQVAAGYTLVGLCFKTGQGGGGSVSASLPIVGPATVTISKTTMGGGLSHVTFDTEITVTPPPPPPPPSPPPAPPPPPAPVVPPPPPAVAPVAPAPKPKPKKKAKKKVKKVKKKAGVKKKTGVKGKVKVRRRPPFTG